MSGLFDDIADDVCPVCGCELRPNCSNCDDMHHLYAAFDARYGADDDEAVADTLILPDAQRAQFRREVAGLEPFEALNPGDAD